MYINRVCADDRFVPSSCSWVYALLEAFSPEQGYAKVGLSVSRLEQDLAGDWTGRTGTNHTVNPSSRDVEDES
jgi:hypothetical protein